MDNVLLMVTVLPMLFGMVIIVCATMGIISVMEPVLPLAAVHLLHIGMEISVSVPMDNTSSEVLVYNVTSTVNIQHNYKHVYAIMATLEHTISAHYVILPVQPALDLPATNALPAPLPHSLPSMESAAAPIQEATVPADISSGS